MISGAHSRSCVKAGCRLPRRSAEGHTKKRVTTMQLAPKAKSRAWRCCWAELKSTSRKRSSRSRNSR
eukprot:1206407-Pleurochrysis_carterae.AAC.1